MNVSLSLVIVALASSMLYVPSLRPSLRGDRISDVPQGLRRCGMLGLWPSYHEIGPAGTPGDSSRIVATRAKLNIIALSLEAYCLRVGVYPPSFEHLLTFLGSHNCPIGVEALSDAWGHPIYYSTEGDFPVATSAGPDEVFSTADDLFFGSGQSVTEAKPDSFCN